MAAIAERRLDLHNLNVDSAAAAEGLCGFTHLASGRVCGLPFRHAGACRFTGRSGSGQPPAGRRGEGDFTRCATQRFGSTNWSSR